MRYAKVDGERRVLTEGVVVSQYGQTDARAGRATLVAGVATISTTAVTTNSDVVVSYRTITGTPGYLSVGTVTPSTSFQIVSKTSAGTTETLDLSAVFWMIVDPY